MSVYMWTCLYVCVCESLTYLDCVQCISHFHTAVFDKHLLLNWSEQTRHSPQHTDHQPPSALTSTHDVVPEERDPEPEGQHEQVWA